ncbi:MAG: hypothetical protein ACD_54C01269G0001 [uncultured bacterium]|nr:MAG: hypothetical protein ACD_54C01269G0001 [uncultured bacterium]
MTNCTSWPAVIVPSRTSRAPIHSTPTTPPNTRKITIIVITARVEMRVSDEVKACSVTVANSARVRDSWVKDCTVCTAPSASEALPELCAIQS